MLGFHGSAMARRSALEPGYGLIVKVANMKLTGH